MKRIAIPLFLLFGVLLAGCGAANTSTTSPTAVSTTGPLPSPSLSVYLSAEDNSTSHSYSVFALNAADGKPRWHYSIKEGSASSPALGNGIVYVSSNDQHIYALSSSDGSVRWQYPLGSQGQYPPVTVSLMVVTQVVYVAASDNTVAALDASTGKLLWQTQIGTVPGIPDVGAMQVLDGAIYLSPGEPGSPSGTVKVLNANDGSKRWTYAAKNGTAAVWGVTDQQVYVAEGHAGLGPGAFLYDSLHALNPMDGKEQWHFSAEKTMLSLVGTSNGVTYLLSDKGNTAIPNTLYALDASTGKIRWQTALHDPGSQAALAGGSIFITADNNSLAALDLSNGKMLWHVQVAQPNQYSVSPGIVTAANGAIYVDIYADGLAVLNASDGSVKWRYQTQDATGNATIAHGILYLAASQPGNNNTGNAYMLALNPSDGQQIWRYDIGVTTGVPGFIVG